MKSLKGYANFCTAYVWNISALYLVLQEEFVCHLNNPIDVNNSTDAGDLHIGQQCEHHDGLHEQLPVLGLRNVIEHGLHMHSKLDLSLRHLQHMHR